MTPQRRAALITGASAGMPSVGKCRFAIGPTNATDEARELVQDSRVRRRPG
jgi:hypothetical protein